MYQIMKNVKISAFIMIAMIALLSTSCSDNNSTGVSSYANPELWKTLKGSDWAAWSGDLGTEIKFVGNDRAIVMEWIKDPVTQGWIRKGSYAGTVEFLDETWFLVNCQTNSKAFLYTKADNTFENSDGAIFRVNQINAFHTKK